MYGPPRNAAKRPGQSRRHRGHPAAADQHHPGSPAAHEEARPELILTAGLVADTAPLGPRALAALEAAVASANERGVTDAHAVYRSAIEQVFRSATTLAADDAAEKLGHAYEHLLAVRVETKAADSICLRPHRHWIRATELLAQPPEHREKWLSRKAGLTRSAAPGLADALRSARTTDALLEALAPLGVRDGARVRPGQLVVQPSVERRRSGSHYTPAPLARKVAERTLAPLLANEPSAETLLGLRICDPSMGSGIFLAQTASLLAEHLVRAHEREREHAPGPSKPLTFAEARRLILERCVFGVDRDPVAVDLARTIFSLLGGGDVPREVLDRHFVAGDALVGRAEPDPSGASVVPESGMILEGAAGAPTAAFDWPSAFPEVFERNDPGFDAIVGNPPWIAYAGRAAQPLDERLATYYRRHYPGFAGYRTLHGLFVYRAASLLRRGGRLGLVLPTSVADLQGYAPARAAHDSLCEPDRDLLDFGDGAFDGVFQPCMALTSTRRSRSIEPAPSTWSLARSDDDPTATALYARLAAIAPLSPALFGERGFQSMGNDTAHLHRSTDGARPRGEPLREGADVAEFEARTPTLFADVRKLSAPFRPRADWERVRLLVRQTARYPIAALSDGTAFRNSVLAGFEDDRWPAPALLCYLNSSLIRWFHFHGQRDARQGMPQLKIGHLRRLPDVPDASADSIRELRRLGARLGARNAGIREHERARLDALVFAAHGLSPAEAALVLEWARNNPPPVPRRKKSRS